MRRSGRVAVSSILLLALVGAAPTLAASPTGGSKGGPETIVIDGRQYGPKDGLKVETFQFEIVRGSGDVQFNFEDEPKPGSVTPQITWGSSYAISTETFQIRYDGKAKAAANIFESKRIIQVCIWYERDNVQKGDKVCSKATSTGYSWIAGPEKTTWCWDDLDPNAPKTIFNFQLSRINPTVY